MPKQEVQIIHTPKSLATVIVIALVCGMIIGAVFALLGVAVASLP